MKTVTFKSAEGQTDSRLPNLFIIGATKSGSTALYSYINQHPQVYMSSVKEPQFFSNDDLYRRGMEYYLSTFFSDSEHFEVRGEATPHYLYYEKAAARLKDQLPESHQRFIVVLRNPIERAYSLYWNMVSEGHEALGFEDAIRAEKDRALDPGVTRLGSIRFQYVDTGKYAMQLRTYFKYFDRKQIHIAFHEDLRENPQSVLDPIWGFLGLERPAFEVSHGNRNAAWRPRSQHLHRFLRQPNWLKRKLGGVVPERYKRTIADRLIQLNKREFEYPPMGSAIRRELRDMFRDDVLELQAITGRHLQSWLEA